MPFFTLFILVAISIVYVNSVRFKHIDSSCHFLELNYKGLNLNFLKLKQLCIVGDIESNPGPIKIILNPQLGAQRKSKCSNEQQKCVILVKAMSMLLVIQRHKIVFSIQFNQLP